jgi:hypothetical protein
MNGIVLLLCSFQKVAALSRSQNMTAKSLAPMQPGKTIGLIFSAALVSVLFVPGNLPGTVIREKSCAD